jgi:hypothetical protein
MSDVQDLWILSIPARNPREAEGIRDWLENACDASPVEARLLSHAFREQFPEAEALVRHCGAKDWTTFWQHHFHPVEV